MTRTLLAVLTLGCTLSLAHAQNGQVYYGAGAYPQGAPPMNQGQGYYGYPQPVQRTQYPTYGNYPSPYPPAPVYYAPRPSYPVNPYGYNNGYGVNYHYVQNPIGFSSTPAPYSAVANNRALGRPTIIQDPAPPYTEDDNVTEFGPSYPQPISRGPALPFHRKPADRFWVSSDYVGMFIRPMRMASPLLTTGSLNDNFPGALGQPSTSVLFPNNNIHFNLMSGIRAQVGMFLDCDNRFSLELGGFWIMPTTESYIAGSDGNGNPLLARPIFNTSAGREGAFLNSAPDRIRGTFQADFRSLMAGAEINARYHAYIKERLHADALVGFRYMRLSEQMQIMENIGGIQANFLTFRGAAIGLNESLIDDDYFATANQFFGPQIGGRVTWEQKWFNLTAFAKLGLGVTHQQATIAGATTLVSPAGNQVANGGILALPTNNGTYSRTVFGVLPEFGLNLGIDVTQCVRVNLGYSLLLWNHVLRPGSQFDRYVNPNLVPGSPNFGPVTGPTAPIYRFNDEFFWAHSFNIGLELHF